MNFHEYTYSDNWNNFSLEARLKILKELFQAQIQEAKQLNEFEYEIMGSIEALKNCHLALVVYMNAKKVYEINEFEIENIWEELLPHSVTVSDILQEITIIMELMALDLRGEVGK